MRILITGASGLLGANLALTYSASHTVVGVVHRHPLVNPPFVVIQADLLDEDARNAVWERAQPDVLIHCAALANLDACERHPDLAMRVNADLPGQLAALAARDGVRMVQISTDAVFDGQRGDYTEEDAPNPLSVYARTKLAGERAVAECFPDALIVRINIFGWSVSGRRSLAEWFLNNLRAGQTMRGFTDVFFAPLLVNDLADWLLRMLAADLHGLYHVVAANAMSKYAFGVRLAEVFDLDAGLIQPSSVAESGLRAPRSPRLTLRTDKLRRDLGVTPPTVEEGVARFHRLFLDGYPRRLAQLGGRA